MIDADRELAEQLLSERFLPLFAHVVLFSLLSVLAWRSAPHGLVLGWGGAVVGISLGRLVAWNWARRRRPAAQAIRTMVRVIMLALGLAWGLGGALVIRYLPPADSGLVLLGLTGLLAGGLATLAADRWTYPIYAVAMFAPLMIVVAMVGPGLFDEMAVILILIVIVFTIRLQQQSHQSRRRQLRVESELRTRERQLASAQAIAHVGSWEWDMVTNVVTWSDELRRMYGVSADAPAGYAEFIARAHPDDRDRLESLVSQTLTTKRSVDYEWRCVRPDGEVRHILGRNVVVTNAAGEAIRMAGTSLDITERKQAEENQRTLLRELQASVAEVKVLKGILPICASCKRIRDGNGKWEAVESYVRDRTNAEFSHGLCPDCAARDWGAAPTAGGA